MKEEKKESEGEAEKKGADPRKPPETDEHPAPGITHEPEPDAENVVPAKHRPGTL